MLHYFLSTVQLTEACLLADTFPVRLMKRNGRVLCGPTLPRVMIPQFEILLLVTVPFTVVPVVAVETLVQAIE